MLLWNEQTEQFEQKPFDKNFYSTARIDHDYQPTATCPRFYQDFLRSSLSDDDVELLQRWFGLIVLGCNPIKKILLNTGLPDRGKSQIAQIAKYLAGKGKFSLLRPRLLDDRFELGSLRDATLLYGADVDSRFLMHEGVEILKSLVGGDPMTGEVKYGLKPVDVPGTFNICLTTNERLRSGSISRRNRHRLRGGRKGTPFLYSPLNIS
jgi:phage/plasmid-associated DNA primase